MNITLAAIVQRRSRTKDETSKHLFADYIARTTNYLPCESQFFENEEDFMEWIDRQVTRKRGFLVLLDSRGKQFSSEEFASRLGRWRDEGVQRLVFAIGPADGWSQQAHEQADLLFSLGRLTLPHSLAQVVLAEQVYRANTILAGHPYHSGH